eukprot:scaffold21260_cov58-Phaeocystis_antarctica.AAC.6
MQQCGGHGCELARFHEGLCTSQQVVGPRQRRPSERVLEGQSLQMPLRDLGHGDLAKVARRKRDRRKRDSVSEETEASDIGLGKASVEEEEEREKDEQEEQDEQDEEDEEGKEGEEGEEGEEGDDEEGEDGATPAQRCGGHGCELARFHEGLCTSQQVVGPRQRRPSARMLAVTGADALARGPEDSAEQTAVAKAAVHQAEAEGLTLQPSDNTTGYRGVWLDTSSKVKPFCASLMQRVGTRAKLNLGRFATAEEAALAFSRQVEQQQQCQREDELLRLPLLQSKHPGVSWDRRAAKWRGAVYDPSERTGSGRGKRSSTKYFADEDECIEARKELKRTIYERNLAKEQIHVKQDSVEECEEDEEDEEDDDKATPAQRCGGRGCELARFHEGLCTSQQVVGPRQRRPSARVLAVAEADASAPGCGPAKKRAAPPSEDIKGNDRGVVV